MVKISEIVPGRARIRMGKPEHERMEVARGNTTRTDAAMAERNAKIVLAGPWLKEIPPAEVPLDEAGKRAYDEVTRMLFDQGKLKFHTRALAENYAIYASKKARALAEGRMPAANILRDMNRIIQMLGIAENAPIIAEHQDRESKFKRVGFAFRIPAQV